MRMGTDLRYLKAKVVWGYYALPCFEDIYPYLFGSEYFSKMGTRAIYYNIKVEKQDNPKTAFGMMVFGLDEYNRVIQGTKTSATTF